MVLGPPNKFCVRLLKLSFILKCLTCTGWEKHLFGYHLPNRKQENVTEQSVFRLPPFFFFSLVSNITASLRKAHYVISFSACNQSCAWIEKDLKEVEIILPKKIMIWELKPKKQRYPPEGLRRNIFFIHSFSGINLKILCNIEGNAGISLPKAVQKCLSTKEIGIWSEWFFFLSGRIHVYVSSFRRRMRAVTGPLYLKFKLLIWS